MGSLQAEAAWPGLANPCRGPLPAALAQHERVQAAFAGLDAGSLWDVHAHLVGTGDSGSGCTVHPSMSQWWRPIEVLRRQAILNAKGTIYSVKRLIGRKYSAPEVEKMREFTEAGDRSATVDDPILSRREEDTSATDARSDAGDPETARLFLERAASLRPADERYVSAHLSVLAKVDAELVGHWRQRTRLPCREDVPPLTSSRWRRRKSFCSASTRRRSC